MKRIYTLMFTAVIGTASYGQVTDTVSIGASYINEVWYSLETGAETSSVKTDWDIAFEANNPGASIIINDGNDTELWLYPGDTSTWASLVDTAGISTWTQQYNSETDWFTGAFNESATGHPDYGWGVYNSISHIVEGNKIFVLKLSDGSYQKIWILDVTAGIYSFKHATLGGPTMSHTIDSHDYDGKNFGYFSLQTHGPKDKEPLAADWDLKFGKYTAFVPTAYVVTGVLQAMGVDAVKAYPVNDPATYSDLSSHEMMEEKNILGSDWKSFNFSTMSYDIADSTVYFVRTNENAIWKVVFTGFGGSADGNFIFTKEKLIEAGIENERQELQFAVYPNPASSDVNIVFESNNTSTYLISDLNGRVMLQGRLETSSFLHNLDVSTLNAGVYIVTLQEGNRRKSERLIIR